MTLGQKRVKAEFNSAKNSVVDQLKNKAAKVIDLIDEFRQSGRETPERFVNASEDLSQTINKLLNNECTEEKKRAVQISISYNAKSMLAFMNDDDFIVRVKIYNQVQEFTETACMYAVKANFIE